MSSITEFYTIAPELVLLLMLTITLLVRLLAENKCANAVYYCSQVSCFITTLAVAFLFYTKKFGISFSGMWEVDEFALTTKFILTVGMMFVFSYGKNFLTTLKTNNGDYYLLSLLALLGMMVLPSAANLLMVFMGIEIMSLPIYAMVALWRENESCVEAALKYFITGAVASCLLLYGFSLLYGATGALDFTDIKVFLEISSNKVGYLIPLAITFICAGFAFKLGAVPFHMWAPDVYEGAPLPVTMLVATLPKIAIFTVMLRVFAFSLAAVSILWSKIFLVVAILSIIIGNLVALAQTNIRRLLAYSSISHMGYMLLGISVANDIGYSASLFYMMIYVLANLAVFGLLLCINYKDKYINLLEDITGVYHALPLFSLLLLIVVFALAGVPPIVGFMAKLSIFNALVQIKLTAVAVVAILFTLLGAYYYISILKNAYFEKSSGHFSVQISSTGKLILIVNTALLLFLGLFPGVVFSLCNYLVLPF
jgi:NADH-quinone oxidoreductase subunit N